MDLDLVEELCSGSKELLSGDDEQKADTLVSLSLSGVAASPGASTRQNEAGESCFDDAREPSPSHRQQEASEALIVDVHGLQNGVARQDILEVISPAGFAHLRSLLDGQRDTILEQLQQLQKLVVLQCRITGTNPLAQEMGSIVLGKQIGKKFGDSLTPKALKRLYNVFSIKDTITKKEAREISALCGATVTQVREFFAGQRSRVRKVAHFSHIDQGIDESSLRMQSAQLEQPAIVGLQYGVDPSLSCSQQVAGNQINHLVLLDTFCGKPDGISSKLYAVEKAEHLINLMHKESTFIGQSQLAQVIMQANDAVLRCFMARGGLQQVIRWLIQAATEEQTSLIRLILKALIRFPLGSASPRHMSLLLQSVNKLRFYRAQDVASRARTLLSRWSRFCKSIQGGKLGSSSGTGRISQFGQKRNRECIHSSTSEDASKKKAKAVNVAAQVDRKQTSEVLVRSINEDKIVHDREKPRSVSETLTPRKRLGSLSGHCERAKEKRKVQLFEECRGAIRRRDGEVTKPPSFDSSSRPLSADDIKKAKRRAFFLNNAKADKHCGPKVDGSSLDLSKASVERVQKRISGNIGLHMRQGLFLKEDLWLGQASGSAEGKASSNSNVDILHNECAESQPINEIDLDSLGVEQSVKCVEETEMDMMPSIHWTLPLRIALDPRWKVASGDENTEVQSEIRRESTVLEATYPSAHCIPSSSAEPAERICLFVDDALVPEILLESVDEESMEKDCSSQSPRDAELTKVHVGETDSLKLDAIWGAAHKDMQQFNPIYSSGTNGLEISIKDAQQMGSKEDAQLPGVKEDQQLLLDLVQSDGFNPVEKARNSTDSSNNYAISLPASLTLAPSMDSSFMRVRSGECAVADPDELTGSSLLTQLTGGGADSLSREQALFATSTGSKAMSEVSQGVLAKDEIPSLAQGDEDLLKTAIPLALRTEGPTFSDQVGVSSSHVDTSGVDLSELSKETCLDMLNIVLQQLADNAKGSGADLELLSVFLKNPQLVNSLMSFQSDSDKGPPATTKSSLGESISRNTLGNLGYQFQELVGRDIGHIGSSVKEVGNSRFSTSEVSHEINKSLSTTGEVSQAYPLLSSSTRGLYAAVSLMNEPSNSQSKMIDSSQQSFNGLSIVENSPSRSVDYGWSQQHEYDIQQGIGAARKSVDLVTVKDRAANNNAYSQNYTLAYPARASQGPGSMLGADQRMQSSLSIHVTGPGHASPSMTQTERKDEETSSRRIGFGSVDTPVTHLLPKSFARTAGMSDGLLPVPNMSANNSRVHAGRVMHESRTVHGGTLPAFSVSPAAVGHQLPHHIIRGAHYNEQHFKQPSVSSPHPSYVSNVQSTSSFISSPFRSQGGLNIWRPPASQSSRPRHIRPGWREG